MLRKSNPCSKISYRNLFTQLIYNFNRKFAIFPDYSAKEVKHLFVPKADIVDSYVVEEVVNEKEKKITDFISFYTVTCGVLKHETIKEYKVALYIFSLVN